MDELVREVIRKRIFRGSRGYFFRFTRSTEFICVLDSIYSLLAPFEFSSSGEENRPFVEIFEFMWVLRILSFLCLHFCK